jgi:hypothetical protein
MGIDDLHGAVSSFAALGWALSAFLLRRNVRQIDTSGRTDDFDAALRKKAVTPTFDFDIDCHWASLPLRISRAESARKCLYCLIRFTVRL